MSTSPRPQKRRHSSQSDDDFSSPPSPASSVSSGFSVLSGRSSGASESDFEMIEGLRNASLEEHAGCTTPTNEYEPARKRTREMLDQFKEICELLKEENAPSEPRAVENLLTEVRELRVENGELKKSNEELKKQVERYRQALFSPVRPIKQEIRGTWRRFKSLNFFPFLKKMQEAKMDELSMMLFHEGLLHFELDNDNLSTSVILDGEHMESHKTHLGEVHRMFGYTRTTYFNEGENSLVTIDYNTYEDKVMVREKKYVRNGFLYVEQERFGMKCTRIYERVEDAQLAEVQSTVTGRWRLQYTVDHRGRVDQTCSQHKIDQYRWLKDTYTWSNDGGFEFSKTVNSSVFLNVCEARTFVKDGKLTTSYRRTDLGDKEILRTERFVKEKKLNVVTIYTRTGEQFKSVYGKL